MPPYRWSTQSTHSSSWVLVPPPLPILCRFLSVRPKCAHDRLLGAGSVPPRVSPRLLARRGDVARRSLHGTPPMCIMEAERRGDETKRTANAMAEPPMNRRCTIVPHRGDLSDALDPDNFVSSQSVKGGPLFARGASHTRHTPQMIGLEGV